MTRRWRVRPADRPAGRQVSAKLTDEGSFVSCPAPTGSVPPIPRRRQPPPTHCGAPRRNGRDLIIATRPAHQPLPSLLSAAAAQEVQAIPEPTTSPAAPIPRDQHRQICTCPPRAKGLLDRRSKRLSFPHFFLRRKKCGRRRPPPRQGKIDSPPQRRKRALFFSAGDSFAPRRERFLCLRRPHFFQQRKKWGKERRQKLRFCTSSARYACSLPPALSLT